MKKKITAIRFYNEKMLLQSLVKTIIKVSFASLLFISVAYIGIENHAVVPPQIVAGLLAGIIGMMIQQIFVDAILDQFDVRDIFSSVSYVGYIILSGMLVVSGINEDVVSVYAISSVMLLWVIVSAIKSIYIKRSKQHEQPTQVHLAGESILPPTSDRISRIRQITDYERIAVNHDGRASTRSGSSAADVE